MKPRSATFAMEQERKRYQGVEPITHAAKQPCHAIQRAKERYGLDLTQADLRVICSAIRENRDAMLIRRAQEGRQVWGVKVQGHWAVVVYIPLTNTIATFLPPVRRRA